MIHESVLLLNEINRLHLLGVEHQQKVQSSLIL